MKTGRLFFTIIGFGALTLGMSLADQPSGQPSGQELDENQTTSDLPAGHKYGNQKGVNQEKADSMHPQLSDGSRASAKNSRTGPIKKVTLPAHRPGQDRPKQVANNHGVAGEKRVDNPQSKLPVVNGFHHAGLNQPSTTVAKDGTMMNRTANSQEELTRRLPVGGETNESLSGVVHRRGAATPISGQLALSRAKTSTAVINGTGMKRHP